MESELTPDILDAPEIADSATQEGPGEQASSEEQSGQPQPSTDSSIPTKEVVTTNPYTDEEATALIESEGKLDASRLTPAQKLVQKSFERHYNPKFQANAEKERQLYEYEQRLNALAQQVQPAPPRNIEEAYYRDKQGTLAQIDAVIEQKFTDMENAEAYRLMKLKENLLQGEKDKDTQSDKLNQYVSTLSNQARLEMIEDMPDFVSKAPILDKFASDNGVDSRLLAFLTNAPVLDALLKNAGIHDMDGVKAVKQIVKFVNAAHERATAGLTAETKKHIPTPKPLSSAGARSTGASNSNDLSGLSYAEYRKARMGA